MTFFPPCSRFKLQSPGLHILQQAIGESPRVPLLCLNRNASSKGPGGPLNQTVLEGSEGRLQTDPQGCDCNSCQSACLFKEQQEKH